MFIWRVFRRLLAQMIRLLLLNRAVTLGLLAVLILAFVIVPLLSSPGGLMGGLNRSGALGGGQAAQAAGATSGTALGDASTKAAPADPSVQTYLNGMLAFDANMMWTALHPQFRSELQSQGVTLDAMKSQEAQKARAGIKFDKVYYIGSFEGNSGLRYYFYTVTFSGTDSSGQNVSSEYAYIFEVAPDGGGIFDIGMK